MGGIRFVYDVYDNKTGLPVILGGTATECAKLLGISVGAFRHYANACTGKKRTVIVNTVEQPLNKFGTRLRKARLASGLTQRQVAMQVGIAYITYKTYEQGRRLPNIEIAARIAKVLKINIKYLSGGFYE